MIYNVIVKYFNYVIGFLLMASLANSVVLDDFRDGDSDEFDILFTNSDGFQTHIERSELSNKFSFINNGTNTLPWLHYNTALEALYPNGYNNNIIYNFDDDKYDDEYWNLLKTPIIRLNFANISKDFKGIIDILDTDLNNFTFNFNALSYNPTTRINLKNNSNTIDLSKMRSINIQVNTNNIDDLTFDLGSIELELDSSSFIPNPMIPDPIVPEPLSMITMGTGLVAFVRKRRLLLSSKGNR